MKDSGRSQASCKDCSGACRALSVLLGRTRGLGRCCLCSQRRGCQGGGAAGGCTKPRGRGTVRAHLWHGHTQPPTAVTATCSCLLRGPLPPSWALLGWGGVRSPDPTPWQPCSPPRLRLPRPPAPAYCVATSPVCPEGSVAAGQLCLLFFLPFVCQCCRFPLLCLIFGWKHGFPPSCHRGASSRSPHSPVCKPARGPSRLDFAQFHLFLMNKDSALYGVDEQGMLRMNWNITAKYSMSNPIFPSK